jgi:hypothetical protein
MLWKKLLLNLPHFALIAFRVGPPRRFIRTFAFTQFSSISFSSVSVQGMREMRDAGSDGLFGLGRQIVSGDFEDESLIQFVV